MPIVPRQIVVRLNHRDQIALAGLLDALAEPHRRDPSISDAVRFAISRASSAAPVACQR